MTNKWQDSCRDIIIESLDLSMLKVSIFDIDHKSHNTTYLSKGEVRSLIKYLQEEETKMCWLSYIPMSKQKEGSK